MKTLILLIVMLMAFCPTSSRVQAQAIPESWEGTWSGVLEIYSGPKLVQSLPMKLTIDTTGQPDLWKYYIQYGPDKSGLRPYYLQRVDSVAGSYVLDEKNGIEIPTHRIGNRLVSQFDVMQSAIQTTVYSSEENLIYEITAGPTYPILMSGDTIIQQDTIPPVTSYRITTLQRAVLVRE